MLPVLLCIWLQSKAQSIWKGSAILWLEKLLCFWWGNSLFSIWTFSYSVSFIHKVPFCQKEMDTAGEMGRERERERITERERETVGKKTRREAGIDDIDHALSWNEWTVGYFYLMDRLTDWRVLKEGKALNFRGVAWWGACADFDVAASESHNLTVVHKRLKGEFTENVH